MANKNQSTIRKMIIEAIRQYQAQRAFKDLAQKGKEAAKKKQLTPKDFGGPFED